jgi:hypothetical protein
MLTINRLREFLAETEALIPSINFAKVVTTDDEFITFIRDRKSTDNTLVFAVAPSYGIDGKANAFMFGNSMQFLFIDKIAEKDMKHDAKLVRYDAILATVKEFVSLIIEAKEGDRDEDALCGIFDFLEEESIEIKPFWNGTDCHGYELFFYMKTK